MKLSLKAENPNYAAKIVSLPALRKHPNADKLQVCTIDGNNVITGLDAKEGDLYVYFPLECAINKDYLSYSNSFSHPELNRDTSKKGFFNDACRVRAVRLRGAPSEGFIVPVDDIRAWLGVNPKEGYTDIFNEVGVEFDHIGDIKFVEKYVNQTVLRKLENIERALKNRQGKVKRTSKLVDNQFRLHTDTRHLKKEIYNINPDDTITASYKMHGANAIFSKLLVKRKLRWYEKLAAKLGVKVQETEYDYIWSSRKVIKANQYFEDGVKQVNHYYDSDIWSIAAQKVNPLLTDGLSVYAELVGHTPTGACIQKDYDYGTADNKMEIYVFRMTYTNASGHVFEFTQPQVKRFCEKAGLKMAPMLYHGRAKDLFPHLDPLVHWHENFLNELKAKYTEKRCFMCKNDVPEEGAVIIVEKDYFEAYKLKSFAFLCLETKNLDSGEVDIETQESALNENTETNSTAV